MVRVLFVCMGNICRSPAAEGVFTNLIKKENLGHLISVDSAGTTAYHSGEEADPRMKAFAKRRGYDLTSLARQITTQDFKDFDYILTMDNRNLRGVLALNPTEPEKRKVFAFTQFCTHHSLTEVPDPYYSGDEGFELVLDIVEDACQGLLAKIKDQLRDAGHI